MALLPGHWPEKTCLNPSIQRLLGGGLSERGEAVSHGFLTPFTTLDPIPAQKCPADKAWHQFSNESWARGSVQLARVLLDTPTQPRRSPPGRGAGLQRSLIADPALNNQLSH